MAHEQVFPVPTPHPRWWAYATENFLRTRGTDPLPEFNALALPMYMDWFAKNREGMLRIEYSARQFSEHTDWASITRFCRSNINTNFRASVTIFQINLRGSYKRLFEGWPNEHVMMLTPLAVDHYYLTRLYSEGNHHFILVNKTCPEFFRRLTMLLPYLLGIEAPMGMLKAISRHQKEVVHAYLNERY